MDFADWVVVVYITFQAIVILLVSIAGVIYVRNEFLLEKSKSKSKTEAENLLQINTNQTAPGSISDIEEQKETIDIDNEAQKDNEIKSMTKTGLVKLWFKIVWKMRSIYACFAVHVFDVLTDILVIVEWWNLEQTEGDIKNINARTMAICALSVLVFHRFITALAFWLKERNLARCLLQLLDLLILQEIYVGHKAIITQFRNRFQTKTAQKSDHSIETSTSFKTVRNLEAIFESMPQSILQLVFITRTAELNHYNSKTLLIISVVSIIQSMISMTNSILNNDNILMSAPKFKKHKQRLPPTIPFLKHALCRLSEVIYRIGLLSLTWTVCGGKVFAIYFGIEVSLIFIIPIIVYCYLICTPGPTQKISVDDLFLNAQLLIVLPSELLYEESDSWRQKIKEQYSQDSPMRKKQDLPIYMADVMLCCLCYYPAALLSTCCTFTSDIYYVYPSFRIGGSLLEWILLILWPLVFDNNKNKYLFSPQYGLYVFIISILCFVIYLQYLLLMPNFELPLGISARSRFGQAFNGELEELKRIKPKIPVQVEWNPSIYYNDATGQHVYFSRIRTIEINNESEFWDMPIPNYDCNEWRYNELSDSTAIYDGIAANTNCVTPAMLALANEQYHIVKWLEKEYNVTKHKEAFQQYPTEEYKTMCKALSEKVKPKPEELGPEFARIIIDRTGKYFQTNE